MKVLSYNIRRGGTGREAKIAAVIRAVDPDLVVLQEATDPIALRAIAGATGMTHAATPYRRSVAYLSRAPVTLHAWHRPWPLQHAFLEIAPDAGPFRVFGVHLSAIHSRWTERRRLMELRALLNSIAAHQHGPHVIVGDFNSLAPGATLEISRLPPRLRPFVWLSGGRIPWRTIQEMLDRGYLDAYLLKQPGAPGFTFPSWDPHLRLDFAFVPAAMAADVRTCDVVNPGPDTEASDHLPVTITV